MLQEDPRRTHLAKAEDRIVALYESTNQPLVQPVGRTAQSAQAAVVVFRGRRGCEVVVALTLVEAGENIVYAQEEEVPESELQPAIDEALNFAESMGFMLDSTGWPALDAAHRAELLDRLPAFRAPEVRKEAPPAERPKAHDSLSAVARLFAAFAFLGGIGFSVACSGPTAEQRQRSAEIHYDLGTNLLNGGDAQGALKEYLEAKRDYPEMPQVHNALGLIYAYSFGKSGEAEAQLQRAIELDPGYSEAHNNLGTLYLLRSRYSEAIPEFEKAMNNKLYAEIYVAESNLGWALYKSGAADKGIAHLKAALTAQPKYCKGWKSLGTIHSERGELPAAAEAFRKYAGACPEVADPHLQLGKVLARQTRVAEARAEFQRCAEAKGEREVAFAAECTRLLKELGAP